MALQQVFQDESGQALLAGVEQQHAAEHLIDGDGALEQGQGTEADTDRLRRPASRDDAHDSGIAAAAHEMQLASRLAGLPGFHQVSEEFRKLVQLFRAAAGFQQLAPCRLHV
jgi:hypothetical protein